MFAACSDRRLTGRRTRWYQGACSGACRRYEHAQYRCAFAGNHAAFRTGVEPVLWCRPQCTQGWHKRLVVLTPLTRPRAGQPHSAHQPHCPRPETVANTVNGTMPGAIADATRTLVVRGRKSILKKRCTNGHTNPRPPRSVEKAVFKSSSAKAPSSSASAALSTFESALASSRSGRASARSLHSATSNALHSKYERRMAGLRELQARAHGAKR